MKILITGTAGFIGSHLVEHYLSKKNTVLGVDNFSGAYPPHIFHHNLSFLEKYPCFSFEHADIGVANKLAQLVGDFKPDCVIHAAALTGIGESEKNPYQYVKTNTLGTHALLEACKPHKSIRVVLLSSSSVYGRQKTVPFDEGAILKPISIYAISKHAMEEIAGYYASQCEMNILIIRPFSVYGPRGRLNMLPFLLLGSAAYKKPFSLYGKNENNQRDWTYIDDFVLATDRLISGAGRGLEIFNVGSGHPVGIEDFVSLFRTLARQILKKDVRVVPKEKPTYEMDITYASTQRLFAHIGPFTFTPLAAGLERFLGSVQQSWGVYFP